MTIEIITARLTQLAQDGRIRQLDLQFAKFIGQLGGSSELVLAAALTCYELGRGHVCLPLAQLASGQLRPFGLEPAAAQVLWADLAAPSQWARAFSQEVLVGTEQSGTASPAKWPLRLWQERLYLTRYYDYEHGVASHLLALSLQQGPRPQIKAALDKLFARDYGKLFTALLNARLAKDFCPQKFCQKYLDVVQLQGLPWPQIEALLRQTQAASGLSVLEQWIPLSHCCNGQKVAVACAVASPFAVISGGPGTGKTTTVAKLLAILVETGLQVGKAPVIRLTAPTGKAAARLTESIGSALQNLNLPAQWVDAMPTQAGTLHRLLGVIPGRSEFRHHAGNPLHLDVLVVDEASMVDLPMMARLLFALPKHARLILLGDKDQLASVEAGAVLADICSFIEQGISEPLAHWLSSQTGYQLSGRAQGARVRDSLCLLSKSWRFDEYSGIGQLAQACNRGDVQGLDDVLRQGFKDIAFHPWSPDRYDALINQAINGYRHYLQLALQGESVAKVFCAFNDFQILCALREGPFGVSGLNERIEQGLAMQKLIQLGREWYLGRPIMISQNDHGVGLYNGDMGLCLPDPNDPQRRLKVWFEQPDGSYRSLLPSRLPAHETVYGMTIHKSQGSEFAHTVLVLPANSSALLTRELVYTGITRAKKQLDLYGDRTLLGQAIKKKTERYSGLALRLG